MRREVKKRTEIDFLNRVCIFASKDILLRAIVWEKTHLCLLLSCFHTKVGKHTESLLTAYSFDIVCVKVEITVA